MDINVNVNVKFEETPALINCFSAFSTALQATVGALAVATTTTHTATEDTASAKGSRKNSKAAKVIPATDAATESVPVVKDERVSAPVVKAEQTAAAAPAPETIWHWRRRLSTETVSRKKLNPSGKVNVQNSKIKSKKWQYTRNSITA